ncbi:hypothetical protein FA95DRAFT_1580754 [Auriscalpium vulgare]|uniref:Uncharacterized protein n=1 Tax=Auriscalpium vulgare TaxID=40419 RepID=A0ACB8S3Y2_9AGAM|nr:hypothetical protein FA95DRAFT_1580754 [Auriscalpium vulgare]
MPNFGFYAVKKGRCPGIYNTWDECVDQVRGFPGCVYRKCRSFESAEKWMRDEELAGAPPAKPLASPPPPISRQREQQPPPPPKQPTLSNATSLTVTGPPCEAPTKPLSSSAAASTSTSIPITIPRPISTTSTRTDSEPETVYSDGSCLGNGQAGSVAGIGVWWGHDDERNLAERCPGVQTNNCAELIAIIRILETTPISFRPLIIKTDSKYSIDCVTKWLSGWRGRGWRTANGQPVKNLALIKYLAVLLDARLQESGVAVKLHHVRGHQGETGNEGADLLANRGAMLPDVPEPDWDARRLAVEARLAERQKAAAVSTAVFSADMLLDDADLQEMGKTGNFD